ncbi:MAG: valine--tRNA ligase [Candidatus Binatia bacterium]
MTGQLEKTYSHKEIEKKWYTYWSDLGCFRPSDSNTTHFSMVIPPPNVTGSLHMGHALNNTLQDILCRYKRMDGCSVLWVPGTDHAGIATQNVVERQLGKEGLTRVQLGRERFIERVWAWRQNTGSTILQQLRALGVSCDWSRERFTMDETLCLAVREAFVRLWEDRLLYRAERLINWCPRCKTALADIEVLHEEKDGHLWYIRYPLVDIPSKSLVVATTRPETMLGDTAVAVNPKDQRYLGFVGRKIRLPIVGREIPVISDPFVDEGFGTGALKITPGHDFNDFEIGERHGLDKINIFNDAAQIDMSSLLNELGEEPAWLKPFRFRDRYDARRLVEEELRETGFLAKVEDYRHTLGRCYRCHTVIEPYLTPQWFVRIKPLAEPAIRSVREGKIRIIPEGWANSYFAWMENIKDWCVSRQIWWGHQIPAWYCKTCDADHILQTRPGEFVMTREASPIVQRGAPTQCAKCGGDSFIHDPDVLDTWFSSALWPFSTLGWPEKTKDLKAFYPTSVLVTGFDILFFWVARMIMMGLKFMKDIPFRDVYIHALVRDQEGQKMSKSKGNVIDPLEVINRYGTDAFRFTLASLAAMGRDVKLAQERIAGYQNFVNKLWNAARFVIMNISEELQSRKQSTSDEVLVLQEENLNMADRWILSCLAGTIEKTRMAIESYRFNEFAQHLYQFTWHEFCDWYIEMSKLSLNGTLGDDPVKTQRVLRGVLEKILLMLHPVIPFVTEEIWQVLTKTNRSIMLQTYPHAVSYWRQPGVEKTMGFFIEVARAVRNLRAEINCPPSKEVQVVFFGLEKDLALLRSLEPYLRALARVHSLEYLASGARPRGATTAVVGATEIYLPLSGLVNLQEEAERLMTRIGKVEAELARGQKKLANKQFVAKAKEEVIQREKGKTEECEAKLRTLNRSLERIQEIRQTGEES